VGTSTAAPRPRASARTSAAPGGTGAACSAHVTEPADSAGASPGGHRVEDRRGRAGGGHRGGDLLAQHGVARPAEQQAVDERVHGPAREGRGGQRGGEHAGVERGAERVGGARRQARGHHRDEHQEVHGQREGDEREPGDRALEEHVGEREAVVLVEDHQGQWDRRVVAHEVRGDRLAGRVVAQVERGHGERRERRRGEGRAARRLAPQPDREGGEHGGVADGQEQQGRPGRDLARPHRAVTLDEGRGGAQRVGRPRERAARPGRDGLGGGLHGHRRQKAQGRERDRAERQQPGRPAALGRREPEVAHGVEHERTQAPAHAQRRRGERDGVGRLGRAAVTRVAGRGRAAGRPARTVMTPSMA
jgi:hypothetical protein